MTTEKNIESTPIEKCVNFTNFMLLLQKVCDYCALIVNHCNENWIEIPGCLFVILKISKNLKM